MNLHLQERIILIRVYIHTVLFAKKINERFKENKSIVKDYIRTVDTSIGKCYSHISDEELYEKYHDKLPAFFVEDIYKDKCVDLKQNDK